MAARTLCLLGLLPVLMAAQSLDLPALPAAANAIEVTATTNLKVKYISWPLGSRSTSVRVAPGPKPRLPTPPCMT